MVAASVEFGTQVAEQLQVFFDLTAVRQVHQLALLVAHVEAEPAKNWQKQLQLVKTRIRLTANLVKKVFQFTKNFGHLRIW